MNILIGCDPELFIKNKKTGRYVSAHGLIPGTKLEPYKVDKGAVQVDGMALEFNIDPASTAEEFESNIKTVMEQLRAMVPDEFEFALTPTATFSKAHFDEQPDEAKELGCEPDYNAYTLKENPRPNNNTLMRTASGHVHIGGIMEGCEPGSAEHMMKCATLAKQLDWFLALPSMVFDKDQTRRTMYGQAGAFRPKPYGCEYRVLSNAWLSDPKYIRWVFNQTRKAVEHLVRNKGAVPLIRNTTPGSTVYEASMFLQPNYANYSLKNWDYIFQCYYGNEEGAPRMNRAGDYATHFISEGFPK